jgi:hypothetical protein
MTQQFFDRHHVCAVIEKVRCRRMPQLMGMHAPQAGAVSCPGNDPVNIVGGDRCVTVRPMDLERPPAYDAGG